jgi:hypothetical protein
MVSSIAEMKAKMAPASTETGARWFTQPAHSVDDPFGYEN